MVVPQVHVFLDGGFSGAAEKACHAEGKNEEQAKASKTHIQSFFLIHNNRAPCEGSMELNLSFLMKKTTLY